MAVKSQLQMKGVSHIIFFLFLHVNMWVPIRSFLVRLMYNVCFYGDIRNNITTWLGFLSNKASFN